MTKIKILDTPQAYKDIVEFGIVPDNLHKLHKIGNEYDVFREHKNYYEVKCGKSGGDWYDFPKSACEIIEEPNYLEQAREHRNSMDVGIDESLYEAFIIKILTTQDLILKHLESKEVE